MSENYLFDCCGALLVLHVDFFIFIIPTQYELFFYRLQRNFNIFLLYIVKKSTENILLSKY